MAETARARRQAASGASAEEPADVPADVAGTAHWAGRMGDALRSVLLGKPEAIELAVVTLMSGGHLLIEDLPGVGKTLLAKALAVCLGGTMRRVQATPDLLPADLVGVSIWEAGKGVWEFHPGPLFANVVLVDELNRATPRTQSALLEAMEEHQVTVDGTSHRLPEPFFVVATQNPFEHAGTFPLVEGQRDRFAVTIEMGYPPPEAEREVLLGRGGVDALDRLAAVGDPGAVRRAALAVRDVHCEPAVADYVVRLSDATRHHPDVAVGASPRGSLALLRAAQARAVLHERAYVTPEDVQALAVPVLAHRLLTAGGAQQGAAVRVVEEVLGRLPVPRG